MTKGWVLEMAEGLPSLTTTYWTEDLSPQQAEGSKSMRFEVTMKRSVNAGFTPSSFWSS